MIKRGFFADMKKILTVILIFCIYVAVPAVITLSVNSDDSQGVSQENIYGPRVNVKYKNGTKSVSVNEFVTMVLAKRFESGDETETLKAMGIMIRTDIYRVMGLLQLDLHVLHQILVDIFRLLENILELGQHHLIPADGGVEEYHALLQLHQR